MDRKCLDKTIKLIEKQVKNLEKSKLDKGKISVKFGISVAKAAIEEIRNRQDELIKNWKFDVDDDSIKGPVIYVNRRTE